MALLQKIHSNKILCAVISVILCIVLMFCIVSKPFEVKVNAIAGLDDAIFWAIVAALLQFGIVIEVSNPEAQQAVADFFWSLTDQLRDEIGIAAAFWRQGYSVYYDWAVESWSNIAHAIGDWFTTERYPQSSILHGGVASSSGLVDLYTSNSIRFTFPEMSGSSVVDFAFNDCIITYYLNPSKSLCASLIGDSSSDLSNSDMYVIVIAPLHSDVRFVYRCEMSSVGFPISHISGSTFYNRPLSIGYSGNEFLYGMNFETSPTSRGFPFFSYSQGYSYYSCFMFGDTNCRLVGSRGTQFSYQDSAGNIMNNMTFSDGLSALAWFFDLCGINIRQNTTTVYTDGQVETDPVLIDPATVQAALDNIDTLPADSTVPVILPGTETQYRQLVSSVPVSSLYDADIDMPTVDGNLWKTKFPFCIPFDLINLFSGFSAEAQAPSFHVLVMPANSFGLDNDDIYWDIDFQPYNYLVQILRFFLALGFVLWLILQTRKLIRG